MDERAEPPGDDVDRLAVLEQQVRQLTSRLAGWVEAQLVQSLEDRRSDMKALRNELQVAVNEQLAGIRAESSSVLSVTTRRLEVAQEQLSERVEAVAARAADGERIERVERQLATVDERVRADLEAVRAELRTAVAEGPQRAARLVAPNDGLEQRVRAAMSRLSESFEAKLAELGTGRDSAVDALRAELQKALAENASELRSDVTTASTALRARVGQVQERLDGLDEQQRQADERVARLVDTKLAEVVDRRREELDAMKWELQEALAKQLAEARAEIGTSVSDAHRRFVEAVDRLDERVGGLESRTRRTDEDVPEVQETLAQQVRDARAEIGTVVADSHRRFLDAVERLEDRMAALTEEAKATSTALGEEAGRIGALEEHTRRTDARLTDLVEAKLAEVATDRIAELDEFRAQLRNALDAHLVETRADVASAVDELRRELAAGASRLDRREAGLAEVEERLSQSVEAKLVELDGVGERVLKAEDELAATVAAAELTAALALEQVQAGLRILGDQVDTIAVATAKAAFAEEGALAPVRSDVHLLRTQLAELAGALAELRPRPKATAPTKAEERARALAAKRAAVAKPAPPAAPAPATVARAAKAVKATKVVKAKKAAPRRRAAQ